jgi:hypothetical protein
LGKRPPLRVRRAVWKVRWDMNHQVLDFIIAGGCIVEQSRNQQQTDSRLTVVEGGMERRKCKREEKKSGSKLSWKLELELELELGPDA